MATQTARVWEVKKWPWMSWRRPDVDDARAFFRNWYRQEIGSRLEPVQKVAPLFSRSVRPTSILTYFRYRLSKAISEGINSCIQKFIQKACGYRNRERFKRDILFHLGGLDLYAQTA